MEGMSICYTRVSCLLGSNHTLPRSLVYFGGAFKVCIEPDVKAYEPKAKLFSVGIVDLGSLVG